MIRIKSKVHLLIRLGIVISTAARNKRNAIRENCVWRVLPARVLCTIRKDMTKQQTRAERVKSNNNQKGTKQEFVVEYGAERNDVEDNKQSHQTR